MRVARWVTWIAGVAAFASACSSDGGAGTSRGNDPDGSVEAGDAGTGGQGGGGGTLDGGSDFCPRFYAALCDHYELCGCAAEMVQQCRGSAVCTGFGAATDVVASGDIVLHLDVLDAILARLRDPAAPCERPFADLGFDSVSVFSFGGVFEGTHAIGDLCSSPVGQKGGINDCKAGALCIRGESGQARCVAIVGRGGECDVGPDPGRMCFDRRPPDSDNEFESAFDFLVCVPSSSGSTTGTCLAGLDDGALCHMDETCKSGRCVSTGVGQGVCAPTLADGAACDARSDCSSGACSDTGCSAPLADGEACGFDDENCASGSCYAPDDQTSGKSPGACGPKLDKALGSSCTQSYECASGVCRGDTCRNPICK